MGNDLATVGIHCQMELAPVATGSGAMLLLQSLPGAIDFQSRAVDHHIKLAIWKGSAVVFLMGATSAPDGSASYDPEQGLSAP
jgi:hypothetical protein